MLSSGVTDRVLERGQPAAQLSSMATAPLRTPIDRKTTSASVVWIQSNCRAANGRED